ncbi:MAG: ArsR family transcriptional regulator [Candidatus Aenigmarchaeota archaeon]|nr:ArsR family transcriptional regulator [Candidatus Aenigmarchaeota archaeon]
MKTICEVVVQDILPTLRAAIAKELIASYDLNQGEVAKLLDVSQPAVSQYLRQLRGKHNFLENAAVQEDIKELGARLHGGQISIVDLSTKMCAISKSIIDNGLIKTEKFHAVEGCIVCK